jgi:trk system potassium uptake protein TrkH
LGSKRNKNDRNREAANAAGGGAAMRAGAPPLPVRALPINQADSGIAAFMAWLLAAVMLLGFIMFTREGTLPQGEMMSWTRALFTVVNTATLTGFQTTSMAVDAYNWPGQWMILLLTITGTLFALIVGGIAVARIAKLPYSDFQISMAALQLQCVMLLAGISIFHRTGQSLLASALQACSAWGNSGVWMGTRPSELLDWRTHLFLLIALLGGFGLPVLMDLFDAVRGKRELSTHSLTVLAQAAIVYVLTVAIFFGLRWPSDLHSFRMTLASSSAAAINSRSAGLPIEYASVFPRYLQWILILLMYVGAAPGGSGGGVKTTTIGKLFSGIRDLFAGRSPGRVFGIAIVWACGFATLIFLCLLFLVGTEPGQDADHLLFIAASAAGNVGMAHDRVGIVGKGMYVLSITMLLGRILPVLVLWWVVKHADETDVAIG